jgi:nucleoid-associated protein YgaU
MTLGKLTITPFIKSTSKPALERDKAIEVLFNPNTYTITKTVKWNPPGDTEGKAGSQTDLNAPTLSFGGGESRQLSLDLFFDVTEPLIRGNQIRFVNDVRDETDKIVALTRIKRNQSQPPVCQVMWGDAVTKDFPFIGVITSLTQKFTLFNEKGNPVRATLTVTFLEFLAPEIDKRETDPEQTTHIIKRGETLSSIAGDVYHNPALWRIIAEANRMDNPRELAVGQTLSIPKYGRG